MSVRKQTTKWHRWCCGLMLLWLALWWLTYRLMQRAECCVGVRGGPVTERPTAWNGREMEHLQDWPWTLQPRNVCAGAMQVWDVDFARLRNVTVSMLHVQGPTGGEPMQTVLRQPETSEFYRLPRGFFTVQCDGAEQAYDGPLFRGNSVLNEYSRALVLGAADQVNPTESEHRTALVLTRYEYANLCHSVTYYYNAYLMARHFQLRPEQVEILVVDAHPAAPNFDEVWNTLFAAFRRVGSLRETGPVRYHDMIWSLPGYHSPIMQVHLPKAPLIEDFRAFFLERHGVADDQRLNCSALRVTFIWRRDYVSHPRNPEGRVNRQISNEYELLSSTRRLLSNTSVVQGVQLETLSMAEQLELVAHSDVLLGMHGAGLMHAVFLPRHGGLVELFPSYWPRTFRFKKVADWRRLKYSRWVNTNERIEQPGRSTYVAPQGLLQLLKSTLARMGCP